MYIYENVYLIIGKAVDKQFPKYKNSRLSKGQCDTSHALSGVSCVPDHMRQYGNLLVFSGQGELGKSQKIVHTNPYRC